jgi:predicted amidophosphoribosyltransferase
MLQILWNHLLPGAEQEKICRCCGDGWPKLGHCEHCPLTETVGEDQNKVGASSEAESNPSQEGKQHGR